MNILFTDDRGNYDPGWPRVERQAVRGIILDIQGKLAMIRGTRYGDVKFPGGGVEPGESHQEALLREVREESGLLVRPESLRPFGAAVEIRRDSKANAIFHHTSNYFFCDVAEGIMNTDLDEYEQQYGYCLVYLTPKKAHEMNVQLVDRPAVPWVGRETRVLRLLMNALAR